MSVHVLATYWRVGRKAVWVISCASANVKGRCLAGDAVKNTGCSGTWPADTDVVAVAPVPGVASADPNESENERFIAGEPAISTWPLDCCILPSALPRVLNADLCRVRLGRERPVPRV